MRVLIIGAGAVGYHLAERLAQEAQEVVIVDPDSRRIQHAADNLDVLAIQGSGADMSILLEAGLTRANILAAVSGVEEVNLLACLAASRAGVEVKVARVRNPAHFAPGSLLSAAELGVDLMISPERECAWEVFQLLSTPAATDLARLAEGRVQMLGMRILPGAPVDGKTLAQLDRELKGRPFVLVAVVRDEVTLIPTGSTVLRSGDKVYLLSPTEEVPFLPQLAGYPASQLRRVIIAGGSDEGEHLARHLAEQRVHSTILELNPERSRELAENLPDSLVLLGDARDMELLEMEGVGEADGFVALTDRDEVNMVVALMAKSLGARTVIPIVHRTEYMKLVDRVGLDAVVSPRISAANAILRHIWKGPVSSVVTVKGSRAEIIEVVVAEGSEVVGRRLRDLALPEGAVLGVLVRGEQVVMPRGRDIIHAGDRAIFFVIPEAMDGLARMIQ